MNTPNNSIQLTFPSVSPETFEDAQRAIQQEYDDANSWKRLHCSFVEPVPESQTGSREIYVLHIDHAIEFDWTWEGARAFKPLRLDKIGRDETHVFDSRLWSGNILNVDEENRQIFIEIYKDTPPPRKGTFLVAPFDFLESIKNLFVAPKYKAIQPLLAGRLTAAKTGADSFLVVTERQVDPEKPLYSDSSAPTAGWWNHAWSIMWGPPGTGKTHTTGQLVAEILKADPEERILVISTTNLATDEVAIKIGKAALDRDLPHIEDGRLLRLGKGATLSSFARAGLEGMLVNDKSLLEEKERLQGELDKSEDEAEKALFALQIDEIEREMIDPIKHHFLNDNTRAVICTSFMATRMAADDDISDMIEEGNAPFTTVVIDEAGLISRMQTAALSLLAAKRVVLVGDSKQLSPISRISRMIETELSMWIASSGLVHLDEIPVSQRPENVHFLQTQWRMHPQIADAVSAFMYGNGLRHAKAVLARENSDPFLLYQSEKDLFSNEENASEPPRAVWYVLDEELKGANIRHDRGPGNKSYVREGSLRILDNLFEHEGFAHARGLFISPFVAQAKRIREYFAQKNLKSWKSSTVHCQQGQEADIVIFDTVNAGSTGWTHHEWMRMINVGISRAKRLLVLLASRAEMSEPYLKPLCRSLDACTLSSAKGQFQWKQVESIRPELPFDPKAGMLPDWIQKIPPSTTGRQVAERKLLDPVLSQLQQQLCNREMDGKPRLVRGVAGSGKTAILAEWLVRSLLKNLEQETIDRRPFWIVFGNNTLEKLIRKHVDVAWEKYASKLYPGTTAPPEGMVSYLHIVRLLDMLAAEFNARAKMKEVRDSYDYDTKSEVILDALPGGMVAPRCRALFIDEAQDMGPNTLRLLFKLVAPLANNTSAGDTPQPSEKQAEEKPVYIFYDNAQNVYNRSTPTWSHLGLDLKGGRATVMKESFRSTREIAEIALNSLYRLKPDELGDDHKELIRSGLIEKTVRNGNEYWNVHFNQNHGPKPTVRVFDSRRAEFESLGRELRRLLTEEHVEGQDIRILCNYADLVKEYLNQYTKPLLPSENSFIDEFSHMDRNSILVSSVQSFKGYESEIVFIPGADMFSVKNILAPHLYVAMTRARSILSISLCSPDQLLIESDANIYYRIKKQKARKYDKVWPASPKQILEKLQHASQIHDTLTAVYNDFLLVPPVEESDVLAPQEMIDSILSLIPTDEKSRSNLKKWLNELQAKYELIQEPILSPNGEIIAEPVFYLQRDGKIVAYFGEQTLPEEEGRRLATFSIEIIRQD